jgi:hypothetical protein
MLEKQKTLVKLHHGSVSAEEKYRGRQVFRYGSLRSLAQFTGTHPSVMKERIACKSWRVSGSSETNREHRHNKLHVRFLSWLERNIFHRTVFEGGNYRLVKNRNLKTYPFAPRGQEGRK